MKYIESLASYVPGLIVDQLVKDEAAAASGQGEPPKAIPWRQEYETVCVFCDVSGFTALSEAMQMNGKGAEGLAKHLNSYFSQMVRLIASEGGDVFKFAGDAMIVLWPESEESGGQESSIAVTARRAAQCAFAIQKNLHKSEMEAGVSLSVKIGIGVGLVSVLHVGGAFNRVEYLAVGDPLIQAFASEGKSVSGQVICSKDVWTLIHEHFTADTVFDDGYVRFDLQAQNKLVPKSSKMKSLQYSSLSDDDPVLERRVKSYVAGAVLPNLNRDSPEDEQWGNELRQCTVVFVNLGLKESHMLAAAVYDEAMVNVHEVLMTTQQCIYQYEGSINKFLLDDKGSTLIACFGLPPLAHDDDPGRAVLASLLLCQKLFELGLVASIGVTTGDVFCGVVGSKTRREYTVLGDSVNLSARLMQKAGKQGGGVLCDLNTKLASGGLLHFQPLGEMHVKGKSIPVKVFQPYPSGVVMPTVPNFKGLNPFTAIHKLQLQNVVVRRTFSSLEAYFSSDSVALHLQTQQFVSQQALRVETRTTSRSGGRRSSMVPSFGVVEDCSSPPLSSPMSSSYGSVGLIDHVRQGGHTFRTRKSIVRPSYDYNSDLTLTDASSRNSVPRGGKLKQQRRASALGGYKVTEKATLRTRDLGGSGQVHVIVPTNLAMDTLISNNLEPINIDDLSDFAELRSKIHELAVQGGHISSEVSQDDLRLLVAGTRFFLPVMPCYSIKWLSTFYQEAKSGFNDNWLPGDPIDLIVFSKKSMRATQSRLALAHCALLERKIALVESSRGSVTLIEGEVGVGKTHFVVKFISDTMFNTCPVYFSHASAFSSAALGPFVAIVRQHLDTLAASKGSGPPERGRDRTAVLCGLLRQAAGEEMYLDSPLLDEQLGTHMHDKLQSMLDRDNGVADKDPVDSSVGGMSFLSRLEAMSSEEVAARRFQLYLYLMLCIGSKKPAVIIIDDAQSLDDDSWSLLLLLSLLMYPDEKEASRVLDTTTLPSFDGIGSPKLMIVVTFRPLVTHRSVFKAKSAPYEALTTSPAVLMLKLDGLPPEEVEELLVETLEGNIASISDELYKLVELKCMANPWVIKRLLEALQTASPPVLHYHLLGEEEGGSEADSSKSISSNTSEGGGEEGGGGRTSGHLSGRMTVGGANGTSYSLAPVHVELVAGFSFDKCPLPLKVAQSFGTIFDRLNSCQRMILKTACHLGKQFTWSALSASYPLEGHKYRLRREMNDLLVIGLVVEIPNTNLTKNDQTYHFISDFLMDFIVVLMLKDQKEKISSHVIKFHTDLESKQRKQFIKKNLSIAGSDGVLKMGVLEVQKEVSTSFWKSKVKRRVEGDWKHRFCVINYVGLSMYRDKHHYDSSPSTATQVVYLRGATTHLEPLHLHGDDKEFVFRVDASSYLKEKHTQLERRSFILNGSSSEDTKAWIYMLKYASEACEVLDAVESGEGEQRRDSVRPTEVASVMNRCDGCGEECWLEVTVVGTDELSAAEVFGASSNCYVCCSVGADQRFTSVSFDSRDRHSWKETFAFPLSREQWAQGQVQFTARKKDIMMTDDILGSAVVDIGSLSLDKLYEETLWLPLERRDMQEVKAVGKLCVEVKLELSQELKDQIRASSREQVQQDIAQSIQAASVANKFHTPGRINTLHDLSRYLRLVEPSRGRSAGGGSLRRRLVRHLLGLSTAHFLSSGEQDPLAETVAGGTVVVSSPSRRGSLADRERACGQELVRGVEALLESLQAGGGGSGVGAVGTVSAAWVCRELRGVLAQARARLLSAPPRPPPSEESESDREMMVMHDGVQTLNPFEGVMEQTGQLGQHEQAWLTIYSQPSTLSQEALAVNVEKETSLFKQLRRASQVRIPVKSRIVKMRMAGGLRIGASSDSGPGGGSSLAEPDIFDPRSGASEEEDYYVLDAHGDEQGPFSARQLHFWLGTGHLHPQVFVRHGARRCMEEEGADEGSSRNSSHFFPLAVFERPLHRIVCQSLVEWPSPNSASGIHSDMLSSDINNFCSWDFDIWALEPFELAPLSMLLMSSLGLSESFGIDAGKWRAFMTQVTTLMTCHNNPYHNYYHCCDVAQTCFVLLTHFQAGHLFRSHEILSLMVSAFVHDLDHPGVNNGYQVNKGTDLAIRYNDASVLENHHCAKAFEVINASESGILDSLDHSTRRSVRKLMIKIILATDMSFHFALQADINKLAARECFLAPPEEEIAPNISSATNISNHSVHDADSDPESRDRHSDRSHKALELADDDRETLLKVVLHVADISNSAKKWSLCRKWSDLVCAEFFQQGDLEKSEGLPVSASMDRDTTPQDELSLNFNDFIIAPYFFALTAVLPKLSVVISQIEENRGVWHDMLMTRLRSAAETTSTTSDPSTDEVIAKWEKREKLFLEAVSPVVKLAAEKEGKLAAGRMTD